MITVVAAAGPSPSTRSSGRRATPSRSAVFEKALQQHDRKDDAGDAGEVQRLACRPGKERRIGAFRLKDHDRRLLQPAERAARQVHQHAAEHGRDQPDDALRRE